jgi:hypothetical protein
VTNAYNSWSHFMMKFDWVPFWKTEAVEAPVSGVLALFEKDDVCMPEASDYGGGNFEFSAVEYDPITDTYTLRYPEPREPVIAPLVHALVMGLGAAFALRSLLRNKRIRKFSWSSLLYNPITPTHAYARLRGDFTSNAYLDTPPLPNHAHGTVAALRVSALRFIDSFALKAGLLRYSYQMSASEQRCGIDGFRDYVWAKDTQQELVSSPLTEGHLITLVDVDYYIDMPTFLASQSVPVVLYTITPESAGTQETEFSFSFGPNSTLNWNVSGGAQYSHQLWDYGQDNFVVSDSSFGIPYRAVLYDVQRITPSRHRSIVLLTPIRTFYGVGAALAVATGRALQRYHCVSGDFAKVRTQLKSGKLVSIARINTETSVQLPATIYDGLVATRNIAPQGKINNYQVKQRLATLDENNVDSDATSAILTEFLNTVGDFAVPISQVNPPAMVKVSFTVPEPEDAPAMVAFGNPYVPPAFVPLKNPGNANQSILGRVLLTQAESKEMLGEYFPTHIKNSTLREFVHRLIPTPHDLCPVDFDDIAERQTKPRQRADIGIVGLLPATFQEYVVSFMKAEAYGKPTDTRNITTFDPVRKVGYAQYVYPLMDHVKQFPFYAFGTTPRVIAERVASICLCSASVECPDLHRMDGFVNEFCRALEQAIGLRLFRPEYHDDFIKQHRASYDNKGINSSGFRYDQGFTRGSGEMGTSIWNTLITLFILFYAKYTACSNYQLAWDWLLEKTMAGGDDSIAGDIDNALLIRTARNCGFIMKSASYKRGDVGVNFLARIYGRNVWEGDANSMCSLKRQMEKFHLTAVLPLEPVQKLYEKALSFAHSDLGTPILGQIISRVLKLCPNRKSTGSILRFDTNVSISEQYYNTYADWMDEIAERELPHFERTAFEEWIGNASLDALLNPPQFYPLGMEYTWDEWDAEPGLLIARTKQVLIPRTKKDKAPTLLTNVKFGTFPEVHELV